MYDIFIIFDIYVAFNALKQILLALDEVQCASNQVLLATTRRPQATSHNWGMYILLLTSWIQE